MDVTLAATFTDATEHKRLEHERLAQEKAHRDTLVREVHHRMADAVFDNGGTLDWVCLTITGAMVS